MPNFLKIMDNLDVAPLRAVLEVNPGLFGQRTERAQAYASPHTAMQDIWVRYNDIKNLQNGDMARFNREHDSVWYPAYRELPQIKPIVFSIMAQVEGTRLGGVLITKLPPGGSIASHVDAGWHAGYYDKFFVPIKARGNSVFGFPDGEITRGEDSAFWFRNDVPHWVRNDSEEDRISMIVCIKTDKFSGLKS